MDTAVEKHFDFLYKHTSQKTVFKKSVVSIAFHLDNHYHEQILQKKSGDTRKVYAPSETLKNLQRRILAATRAAVKEKRFLSRYVFGLGKDKAAKENVVEHIDSRYFLKIDLKDFFDNINYTKVKKFYLKLGCSEKTADLVTKLITYNYHVPQGVPTSSFLASMCLKKLDEFVVTVCKINGFVYTRYIDDITISSKEKISVEVQKVIEKIISLEGLKINRSKTVLLDAQKDTCKITGIIIKNGRLLTDYHCGQENMVLL